MKGAIKTTLLKKHPRYHARTLQVNTPHGEILTPAFMPVGTRAAVNCLSVPQLQETGSQIILGGNTYHMLVTPGMDRLQKAGGMHTFMGWQGPMLTDSGGFQVFSLSQNKKLCVINEEGARFKHPLTGQSLQLTPESSLEAQRIMGADIIMAFDQCTPDEGGRSAAVAAMERTHRWLRQSKEAHEKQPLSAQGHPQALFGIIQGGRFQDLRETCAKEVVAMELDGIAIGGESIGFSPQITEEIICWVRPFLPESMVRYTMGVGLNPQNLIDVVKSGIDIFDCVAPTRNARHGALYHGHPTRKEDWVVFESDPSEETRLLIKKACYATDERPLLEGCDCYTCTHHSRAYLHYLFKENLSLYAPLASIHNVRVMQKTCEVLREVIHAESDGASIE